MARRRMYGSATWAIWTAVITRVGSPMCSRASCRARPLMTVASMPIVSAWARSMPAPAPAMPRQMLPPPTTMAISVPRSRWTSATSAAIRATVSPWIPKPVAGSANASPDSLRTTRLQFPRIPALPADHDLGETGERGVAQKLGDADLVVLDEVLLQEDVLLEEAPQPTLDDLGQGRLGLALVAADRLEDLALLLDPLGRDLGGGEELRLREGDVQAQLVGQGVVAPLNLHHHAVDAPSRGLVDVGAQYGAG